MKKRFLTYISPLLLFGVIVVLLPIFTFMTVDRLDRQKKFFKERLLEKGISLIRTFEAGARSGMFTMRWGAQRIQIMLYETSLQPEVHYIMITSKTGKILAHSNDKMVGKNIENMPEVEKSKKNFNQVRYRMVNKGQKDETFEVYKRFIPIRHKMPRRQMWMREMQQEPNGKPSKNGKEPGFEPRDWSQPYFNSATIDKLSDQAEHYIFAGLSMEKEYQARSGLVKASIRQGIFFLILGSAGVLALLAFQAYRSTKASLKNVKAFSDNVIQNMPSGLMTIDFSCSITSMNQAAKDILGQELTRPFPEMLEMINMIHSPNHPGQPGKSGEHAINKEISIIGPEDREIRLDIVASPIHDKDKDILGYLFLFKDLTQISELKHQVETNRRLAAIGKLAAGVAHEIRNPLSSIKGFATYFGKRYEKNEIDKETAQIMVKEVERINRSITQLLEFAKPMAVEKKQVDLHQLIDHSIRLIQPDLDKKNIKAIIDFQVDENMIFTDGDRLNQVLLNLYINAIDALAEKGILSVKVQDSQIPGHVELHVIDNGKGIDPKNLDQIFDPYFTTRPTGTGLGLSIVHRIIENLKGQIRVDSTENKGTNFIITLPKGRLKN